MKIVHVNRAGKTNDISQLVQSITWSGDVVEVARKMDITITVSSHDHYLPKVAIELGEKLMLQTDEGEELWQGYIFQKGRSLTGSELSVTAFDGLIYLTKSKLPRLFQNMTPEKVTAAVCAELGVQAGTIAATGIPQTFANQDSSGGKSGYEAIMTSYTAASKQNGKLYIPRMNKGALDVVEKGSTLAKVELTASADLTEANYAEDMNAMVNTVIITDDKGNTVDQVRNNDWMKNYGLLQTVYQKEEGKDPKAMAEAILHGVDRTASVELIGGQDKYDLIAGNAVRIKEEVTGITGLFYIDRDTHTFQNGHHTISLELNYKNVMDEHDA
ncbi:XkdQ/YqbQ family protein [Paenibacillus sp. KN14-4R]|uniref:XkdQ/YqbQ family protein n=1 Tax=Paenibacillus sp. KN14-4R TaxID=3445773 RepID=UPI003F9FC9D7